ncbi:hypothetical protein N7462_008436 [Penicillium macrosclerotiorum]|uniref:uncharacterized protein n=1 Tax=Penicillium macrosclerotiorum TaxID=303699 RepID=UPI002546D7BE|nr:uncharacterized protein N7462_008436 [Penicillium macrosclerotiorum]KAJ5675539.1 hypothetical protein N7462_008436 [Penicillium macrosclerotiorum]
MSTRSHQGCWTCKRRRRRCDNGHPSCENCVQRGLDCEGYEVRLRWGTGIASRGRFTGADKPLDDSVPPRPKGRQRDRSKERRKLEETRKLEELKAENPNYTELSATTPPPEDMEFTDSAKKDQEEAIFNEFMKNGINVLHSTTAKNSMLQPRLPQLCQESSALYTICLTFQLSLSATHTPRFFEYFDSALREFRSELAHSTILSDGTLTAGLLLCSIGLMHGLPWTMHLEGMHNILQSHGLDDQQSTIRQSLFRAHLLEVMGVMDIPCVAVGRQRPSIGIWRRFCQPTGPRHGIEPVTGLPRTLVDLFAGIDFDTTEQSFWDWSGEAGSFLQCYLWEAHRLAGILTLRRNARLGKQLSPDMSESASWRHPIKCPLDETVLVARILANLDALRLAYFERPTEEPCIRNAVNLPLFIAGLEVTVISHNPQWQRTIRSCVLGSRQDEILLDILEELWHRNDPMLDVDDIARARGVEMGLL